MLHRIDKKEKEEGKGDDDDVNYEMISIMEVKYDHLITNHGKQAAHNK